MKTLKDINYQRIVVIKIWFRFIFQTFFEFDIKGINIYIVY